MATFSDGYTEYGSNIFGNVATKFETVRGSIGKSYKVRLQYYNGIYENRLRLFKLHGSIDSYALKIINSDKEIRVKKDYGVNEFLMEEYNKEANKYTYTPTFTDTYPDFLSGTTEKIRQYNIPFYEGLFNHFKNNLQNSSKLLIVGYGFQDKGINDLLETHYLIYRKPVILIDIKKLDVEFSKTYENQFKFYLDGISNYDFDELMKTIY